MTKSRAQRFEKQLINIFATKYCRFALETANIHDHGDKTTRHTKINHITAGQQGTGLDIFLFSDCSLIISTSTRWYVFQLPFSTFQDSGKPCLKSP